MVRGWFASSASNYNDFIKALLLDDLKAMNVYMNRVTKATFSYFDSEDKPSEENEPERFYHGFVLGLMVALEDRYVITSNRESGFGRYDIMLEPRNIQDPGIIMEFKVQDAEDEKELTDTVNSALRQIEEKEYVLEGKGIVYFKNGNGRICIWSFRQNGFSRLKIWGISVRYLKGVGILVEK